MTNTSAQTRARRKYNEKNYYRISLPVRESEYNCVRAKACAENKSLNKFVCELVELAMAQQPPKKYVRPRKSNSFGTNTRIGVLLPPDWEEPVNAYLSKNQLSMNDYICSLIQRDMRSHDVVLQLQKEKKRQIVLYWKKEMEDVIKERAKEQGLLVGEYVHAIILDGIS